MKGASAFHDDGLRAVLEFAKRRNYRFVTPTPATHARVIARPDRRVARTIEEVLGWNLPFRPAEVDRELVLCLRAAGALENAGSLLRSRVRLSSLHNQLYLHSSYPTDTADAVFFGPDSYRFADLIRAELRAPMGNGGRIADIGTGAGVGIICAALACNEARLFGTDVNPEALRLARLNAEAAGISVQFIEGSALDGVPTPLDLITINPPYIIDGGERAYRDGGDMHGGEVSLRLSRAAMKALAPAGRLILYTGSAVVDGVDELRAALLEAAAEQGCSVSYREIDPDVFGEELEKPQYPEVDRIAVISAVFTRDRKE